MGYVVMDGNLSELERGYRRALCELPLLDRFKVEHDLLQQLAQNIKDAEEHYEAQGGEDRHYWLAINIAGLDEPALVEDLV